MFPWPFSNHDKALNYGCHNTGDGSSIRARGEQDTQAVLEAEEVTRYNLPRKLNSVPVSEVLMLSAQAALWRVRYKPADYLSLNTPALMAAAGQGDSKLCCGHTE